MELRVPPRLQSRDTEEFLPVARVDVKQDDTSAKIQTSVLPYYIARHRKMADSCFTHARGKEHGLKHIDIRKGILALFWIVVFFVVMCILFTMISDLIIAYVAMPVATQIKAEQQSLRFPDVTICTKVPFYVGADEDKLTNKSDSDSLDEMLLEMRRAIVNKMRDSAVKITEDGVTGALLIQMVSRQDDTLLRAYQHLIYCRYHDGPCSFYNFTEIAHLRYVQCFTFAPNNRLISAGKGLQFIFYHKHGSQRPFVMLNDLEDPIFTNAINDGINVFIHNPGTFPTYAISSMPTSFSLRYGQQAIIEVSGLQYQSDQSGRKSCALSREPYKYTNFRGGANYLEYAYTYEDCIANMKQRFIRDECRCYSDNLFVPFEGADRQLKPGKQEGRGNIKAFCRDIRQKTSQRLRGDFLCYDQYENMPTTSVLDKFVPLDKLYDTREDLDTRKIERHKICNLLCRKDIYSTRFFEVLELDPNLTFSPALLDSYVKQLSASQLDQPILQEFMEKYEGIDKIDSSVHLQELKISDLIIVDIRLARELIDVWEEELTESLFNLISNLGGTLGLCAGISFLSSFFLLCFFGRAFFHAFMSFVLWFWWSVYLGRPPPTSLATDPNLGFVQSSVGDLSYSNEPDHSSKDPGSSSSLLLSSVSLWTSGLSKGKSNMQAPEQKPKQDDLTTGDQMETSSEDKPRSSTLSSVPPIQRTMAVTEPSQRSSSPEKKSGRQIFPSRIMVTQPDKSAVPRQQEDKADHEEKGIPSQPSAPEPPVVTVRHHKDKQTDREDTPLFPRADVPQPVVNAAHRHEKGQADQPQDHEFDGPLTDRRLSAEPMDSDDDDEEETTSSETESHMEDPGLVPEQSNLRAVDNEDYETSSESQNDFLVRDDLVPSTPIRDWVLRGSDREHNPDLGESTESNKHVQEKDRAFQNRRNPAHRPRRLPESTEPQKVPNESELPRPIDFLYRHDSDDFPPFIYDPPPPPLVRRPLDGATGRRVYMPEERSFDLPPLLDQQLIPEYLRARYYGDPPPYSAQWYHK
ncbi:hypothetical protein T265_10438 [Opisthorchis viverrini]|uniref:Amiloride-sensitive sodium channel n=1 Tax=Opisthorchis viverrini TaxID=6198 RepID=A0A074ZDB9_OPIVI|nr:hypothetical protein T265_10438 [Opisthorchis viverrini]KER21185.1 hypothetical protein T265_10438 [Opisthorchis viverrini]